MPGCRGKGLVVVTASWAWSFPDPRGWVGIAPVPVCDSVQEVFGGGRFFARGIFLTFFPDWGRHGGGMLGFELLDPTADWSLGIAPLSLVCTSASSLRLGGSSAGFFQRRIK